MNGLDIRRYEMLLRVKEFGFTHTELFPPTTLGGQAFAAVKTAIAQLDDHATTSAYGRGAARSGTTSRAIARNALRERLDAIVRTARALALDRPGMDDKFRTPRGCGDSTLLIAARTFARCAARLATDFIAHDMPADFLEQLDASIKTFEQTIRDHEAARDTHVAARVALESAMQSGIDAVRRLNAIVPNRVRNDAQVVAAWDRARHVEYPRSKVEPDAAPAAA